MNENEYIETADYEIRLSDGWKVDSSTGDYVNVQEGQTASIKQMKFTFDDYYQLRKDAYEQSAKDLGADCVKWEENLGETDMLGVENLCIYTGINGSGMDVVFFYENKGDVYKVSVHDDNRMADAEEVKSFYNRIMMR